LIQLQQAWKELTAQPRFALLFLFNLALGLSGLVTMDAFRHSIQSSLVENERALLSADLAVSVRRPFTEIEKNLLTETAKNSERQSEAVEFFTMVRGTSGARLAMVKAVDKNYPLAGSLELESGKAGAGSASKLNGAWVEKSLARQLDLEIGSELRIGESRFLVEEIVTLDPTQSFRGMAVAGKILIPLDRLEATGLLKAESTASFVRFFTFAKAETPESVLTPLKQKMGADVRVNTPKDAGEDSSRMLRYLADFLGLASLVALFLSSLGAAYLYHSWLQRRSRSFALYQVLGWSFKQSATIPLLQALLLALGSVPVALVLALLELNLLEQLVSLLSPVSLNAKITFATLVVAFFLPAMASVLLALPFLAGLRSVQLRELLGGSLPAPSLHPRLLWIVPALLVFYALALWQAQSYRNAALFCGALLFSLLLLAALAWLLLQFCKRIAQIKALGWTMRHALLHLSRGGGGSMAVFVALSIGALLINLLPQLRSSLLAELEAPGKSALPSIFFFDIQEEQLDPLLATLKEQNLSLKYLSPLVRARLLTINGNAFERAATEEGFRTREEETEARFRNRGFNLSYRRELADSEEIISGRAFQPVATEGQMAEISVETRFASRIGLKIGDKLRFDVQGVEVDGVVVNLRKVRWTSFQPNFFLVFQDGPLNGAPKSYLAALPPLEENKKMSLLNQLADRFPNISAVDVRATIERALDLLERMRWALHLMAAISLFAGLVVLYAITQRQAELRRWDMNICKILGARATELRSLLLREFFLLGFFASAFGALLSVAFTWVLARWIFEGNFRVELATLFGSILLTSGLALAIAWIGSWRVWRSNPAELLSE
jgi:putative ABC transport system permease protein